jgi:SAM-dependent methyltransferase
MIQLPLIYSPPRTLSGASWEDVADSYSVSDPIRQVERASIRAFMERHRMYLQGRVLDFGAGKEPYRDLVSGEYVPYEKGQRLPGGAFDAVVCNQVLQYVDDPVHSIRWALHAVLRQAGHLLLTYATNWDEVELEDRWRFTKSGMEELLKGAGFIVREHELRAAVRIGSYNFPLGYGVLCIRN